MRAFDWVVVVVYLVWIVCDGLRRSKGTDKVEGYFLANRSLPWWAVGLSVMATQMSAVTMVGTTGQAYSTGLRFMQFYFGLPLAMVILSVTVVPFFTARASTPRTSISSGASTCETRSLASLLFLMGRALVARRDARGAGGGDVGDSRLDAAGHGAGDLRADDRLHDVGGVQAVAWTDVKQMFIVVGGMSAAVVILLLRHPAATSASARRCTWPARPAGCRRSTSRSTCARPTRSGRA